MKYSTIYLPVQGDFHYEGAYIRENKTGRIGKIKKVGEDINETEYTHVKLFLCSRDIQVGDTAYNDKFYPYPNGELLNTNSKVMDHGMMEVDSFKVIGEISPDALSYVTEGQEFEIKDIAIGKKYPEDTTFVKVKGPCGHFH